MPPVNLRRDGSDALKIKTFFFARCDKGPLSRPKTNQNVVVTRPFFAVRVSTLAVALELSAPSSRSFLNEKAFGCRICRLPETDPANRKRWQRLWNQLEFIVR